MGERRMKVVRRGLGEGESEVEGYAHLSASERVAMVWELTKTAWAFMGRPVPEAGVDRGKMAVVKRRLREQGERGSGDGG